MVAESTKYDVSMLSMAIYWKNNMELDVYLVSGSIRTYKGIEAEAKLNELMSLKFPVEIID
jgi:hypothetical protein